MALPGSSVGGQNEMGQATNPSLLLTLEALDCVLPQVHKWPS
jgi:hypothetical protein